MLKYLKNHPIYNKIIDDYNQFPLPFCNNLNNVKAIVLGTDPTNRQRRINKVFDLDDPNSPYFRIIKQNLSLIDIGLDEIYVQNLCKNYFTIETRIIHFG